MKRQTLIAKCRHACTLRRSITFIFPLSIFALLFSLFLYPTNSTDLGWHLKYGEYFAQNGRLLKANTFSYIMPDFEWTNDSWVYDVVIYQIFNKFGFNGLAVAGSLVGMLLTFILYRLSKTNWETFAVAFLPFYLVVHTVFYHGLRAQTMSLVFLALTMWLVDNKYRLTRHLALGTLALFVFWANWHGEYMVGLTYIGLVLVGKTFDEWRDKKNFVAYKIYLPILTVGFLASLITPFGIGNHLQAISHIFSTRLEGIGEWSSWPKDSWQWWSILAYAGFLIWNIFKNKKLQRFAIIIPFTLFTIQAILHRRMQGMWAVISFPIMIEIIRAYRLSWQIKPLSKVIISIVMLLLAFKFEASHQPWLSSWDDYCSSQPSTLCSSQMLDFIRKNQIKGKMFNFYNWGGYLIWNYPESQVYIDGRMVSWQDSKTGFLPYQQYDQIMRADEKGLTEFKKLNIDYVLLAPGSLLEKALQSKLGWMVVYRDKRSVVIKPFNN